MTPRENLVRTLTFAGPAWLARTLPEQYGRDTAGCGMSPSPDNRPPTGADEWGAVWENIGVCKMGEVKDAPLKDWADFGRLRIPDIREERRWQGLADARGKAGDLFLFGSGISLYERVHFIRGLENTWADIHEAPERLGQLIDILVDMNLYAIGRYAQAGVDGYMWCDDWGLQDRLMIRPADWRRIWKPRYARVYQAARQAGMRTFLHSCGHIVDILDDLIEIGLDCIQMDQQENMGLDLLGKRFGGRITFWCPVDIQNTMARGNTAEIRAYCRRMVKTLGRPEGGFIAGYYGDPKGAGHTQQAIDAMCDEFVKISREMYE
jgi:hypothetical protein